MGDRGVSMGEWSGVGSPVGGNSMSVASIALPGGGEWWGAFYGRHAEECVQRNTCHEMRAVECMLWDARCSIHVVKYRLYNARC